MQLLNLAAVATFVMTAVVSVSASALPEPQAQCKPLTNFCTSSNVCCGYPKVICRGPNTGYGIQRCLYPDQAYPAK